MITPVIMVALLALAGCSVIDQAAPTESATPTASAAAESISSAVAAPTQVFGGECEAVFSAESVGAALGATVSAKEINAPVRPSEVVVADLGGLECRWAESGTSSGATAHIVVLPAAALGGSVVVEPTYCYGSTDHGACSFSALENGYWLTGVLYAAAGTTNGNAAEASATVTDLFATTAAASVVLVQPVLATATEGAWAPVADCTALDAVVQPGTILGETLEVFTADALAGEMPAGYYAAVTISGRSSCAWTVLTDDSTDTAVELYVELLPAGAWVQNDVAALAEAEELTAVGIERAILVPGDSAELHVFDGVNWLMLVSPQIQLDALYLPVAAAIIAAQTPVS